MSQFQKVGENDWADWRESPLTRAWFQFMDDMAKEQGTDLIDSLRLRANTLDAMINNEAVRAEIRGAIRFSEDMQNTGLLDIKGFYGEEITDDEQSNDDGQ